jgi:hypothetical protein
LPVKKLGTSVNKPFIISVVYIDHHKSFPDSYSRALVSSNFSVIDAFDKKDPTRKKNDSKLPGNITTYKISLHTYIIDKSTRLKTAAEGEK